MLKKTFLVVGVSLLVATVAISLSACSEKKLESKSAASPSVKSEPRRAVDRIKSDEVISHDATTTSVIQPSIIDSDSVKEIIAGKWRLVSFKDNTGLGNISNDSEFTLEFRGGSVNGKVCNSFSGPYAIKSGIITADSMASTEMACNDKIMLYEDLIFKALGNGVSAKKEGQLLILSDEKDNINLSFASLE